MMTYEQIQQMFSEESNHDDEFFLFWFNITDFSASYTQVWLQGGLIGKKTRCVLYIGVTYMRQYTVTIIY